MVIHRWHINPDCEHPEVAFRILDLMCREDFTITSRWGKQGENWDYIDNLDEKQVEEMMSELEGGERLYDWTNSTFGGYSSYFFEYKNIWNQPGNTHWMNGAVAFRTGEVTGGYQAARKRVDEEFTSNPANAYGEGDYIADNVNDLYMFNDIIDGNIHRRKFDPVDQDMYLHFVGTVDPDFTDTGNTGETVGDHIVGKVVQIILRTVTHQKRLHHSRRVGIDLADRRFFGSIGEIFADTVERFADIGGGNVNVDTHIEFQLDLRLVFDSGTGDVADTVQRGNGVFDPLDHFDFDLRWTGTLIFAPDKDRRDLHIGEQVDTDFFIERNTDHDQHDDKCGHCNRSPHRPGGQKHSLFLRAV